MTEIPDEGRKVLEGKNLAHVATLMEDGSPQVTPVWVSLDGDRVLINTAVGRLKDKNLRRDARVAISAVDPENPYAPLLIRGRVAEMIEGDEADEHINALAKKYLDEDEYPFRQPGEERIKLVIEPQQASYGQ